jgi:hypothetical protein
VAAWWKARSCWAKNRLGAAVVVVDPVVVAAAGVEAGVEAVALGLE